MILLIVKKGVIILSNYIYKNPLDQGHKQFYLTKKQHNKLFKNRQIKWYDKYEYYYNDNCILLHKFYNLKAIILSTILLPIIVLMEGLINIKETMYDYKSLCNQKRSGSFSGDDICKGTDMYNEVMKAIKEKGE